MKEKPLIKYLLSVVAVQLLCAAACHAAPSATGPRAADPVVVEASMVPFLHSLPTQNFRAFALRDDAFQPIPFQIDEKTDSERYVFTWGEKNKKQNAGRLAGFDEIVFMSKDAGEKANREDMPYEFEKGAEFEIADPLTGEKSYAYLLYSRKPKDLPDSDVDYVSTHGPAKWMQGDYYQVGQSTAERARKLPNIADYLAIREQAGGNGLNILDRVKFRSKVVALGGTVRFGRDEDSFRVTKMAELDGTVRKIVRSKNSVYLAMGITTPPQTYDATFYFNGYITPVYIDIPIDLSTIKSVVKTAYFRSTLDFNDNAVGMRYYNPRHPKGILVDGQPSKDEKGIEDEPFEWEVLAGAEQGAWMMRIVTPPPEEFPLKLNCFFADDATSPDPPEEIKGQIGNMGFTVANVMDAKAGTHIILVYIYFLPFYEPGDEKAYLDISDNPLQVTASEL